MPKLFCGYRGDPTLCQYIVLVLATFNLICSGLYVGWAAPSLAKLLHESSTIPTTSDEGSWIVTALLLGGLCGSLSTAITLDRLGRKTIILASSIPLFVGWILIAFADSVAVLITARFVAGIGDGFIFCSVPVYLAEISEPHIRGFLGSFIVISNLGGIVLSNIMGSYLSVQVTAIICSVVPLITLVLFVWMPESPYYLVMQDKKDQARKSLACFRAEEEVDDELKRITESIEENKNSGKFLDLFTVKSNRRAVFIAMITRFGQQFSGTSAIVVYSQIIFKEIGSTISPETASISYMSVQLVVAFISSLLVDKLGRKPLLIASSLGVIMSLFVEGCYFYIKQETLIEVSQYSLIPVIGLIFYVIMFGSGLYTVPVVLIGEIFPTNVKAFAISLADFYYCVMCTLSIKLFQVTKDAFGMYVPFFVFCVSDVIVLVLIIIYLPETKGKTLEEVQEVLRGKNKKCNLKEYDSVKII